MKNILLTSLFAMALGLAGPASAVMINEWVSNDISGDDYEFIELCGEPGESLDGLTLILIEGETSRGNIDFVLDLTGNSIGATGYFVVGDALVNPDIELTPGWIENGGNNILLVRDFTGALNDDIDTDDDCVEDVAIGAIVDGVGYGRPDIAPPDCITYYGIPGVGPDNTYDPAGGARCADCDVDADWRILCLDGTEPSGPGCTQADGYYVENATPGAPNACPAVANEAHSWSGVKGLYR